MLFSPVKQLALDLMASNVRVHARVCRVVVEAMIIVRVSMSLSPSQSHTSHSSVFTFLQSAVFYHEHVLVKEPGAQRVTPWHCDQPYYPIDGNQVGVR